MPVRLGSNLPQLGDVRGPTIVESPWSGQVSTSVVPRSRWAGSAETMKTLLRKENGLLWRGSCRVMWPSEERASHVSRQRMTIQPHEPYNPTTRTR